MDNLLKDSNFSNFLNYFFTLTSADKIYLCMFPDWYQGPDSESNWSLSIDVKILDVFSVVVTLAISALDVDNF